MMKMNKWKIAFEKTAGKQLKQLDRTVQKRIDNFIENKLLKIDNPRILGKALKGQFGGFWAYRIGEYRMICDIVDHELIIYAIKIDHRKEVYH